ncbi:MAG: hypothetical protein HUJ31_13610 [Pseudomonadales bacterium]|nr:hypothetical protein [Pseudomonadales bacterium]
MNWLVRQLSKSNPDNIYIKASWPGRALATQEKLANLREDPTLLDQNQKSLLPSSFEVLLVRDAAGKFSGSKTFIEQIEEVVPQFYEQVGQYLRPYVASPPRMKQEEAADENDAPSDVSQRTEDEGPTDSASITPANVIEPSTEVTQETASALGRGETTWSSIDGEGEDQDGNQTG